MPTLSKKKLKNNFLLHIINLKFTFCILLVLIFIWEVKSVHIVAAGNAYCIVIFRH